MTECFRKKLKLCYLCAAVVNELVRDVLAAINEHFAAASQDLTDSAVVLSLTRERNFSQYTMNITNITHLAENASTYAKETLKKVCIVKVRKKYWSLADLFLQATVISRLQAHANLSTFGSLTTILLTKYQCPNGDGNIEIPHFSIVSSFSSFLRS